MTWSIGKTSLSTRSWFFSSLLITKRSIFVSTCVGTHGRGGVGWRRLAACCYGGARWAELYRFAINARRQGEMADGEVERLILVVRQALDEVAPKDAAAPLNNVGRLETEL